MKIEITSVQPVFDGVDFGNVGTYEKVTGRIRGTADPGHRLNAGIINLERAPRNAAGQVEYSVDFCLLKPLDMRRHNGRILYDVLNRGIKLALSHFNDAPAEQQPSRGGRCRQRLPDAPWISSYCGAHGRAASRQGRGRMLASLPIATDRGAPIVAVNRDEFIFNHNHNPAAAPLSYPAHTHGSEVRRRSPFGSARRIRGSRIPSGSWRYLSQQGDRNHPASRLRLRAQSTSSSIRRAIRS